MLRVLILSGGSLVGANILQALASYRQELILIATNSEADIAHLYHFDQVYLVPATKDTLFTERFVEILESTTPDLIIPCRDQDVIFLAEFVVRYPQWQKAAVCGSAPLAQVMNDQCLSYNFAQEHALPFAPTYFAEQAQSLADFLEQNDFPLLAKPVSGFASRQVSLIWNQQSLESAVSLGDFVLQKYIGSEQAVQSFASQIAEQGIPLFYSFEQNKYSFQAFIDPQGAVKANCVTLHEMKTGLSWVVSVVEGLSLSALGKNWAQLFAALGWRGPLNIQCLQDQTSRYWIHEFNGRFTGATAARQILGYDELGLTLQYWCDVPILKRADFGKCSTKQLSSVAVNPLASEYLKNHNTWP